MILCGFAAERKKALENARFTGFSRASSTFGSGKLHSHATVANLTFAFQARFAKQRCIASNYSSSASFGLDSLSFQPSVLQLFGLHASLSCNLCREVVYFLLDSFACLKTYKLLNCHVCTVLFSNFCHILGNCQIAVLYVYLV